MHLAHRRQSFLKHLILPAVLVVAPLVALQAAGPAIHPDSGKPTLVPSGWDAALAGDQVLKGLINTTAPQVKGAHDAEFVCVGDRAFVVAEANEVKPGDSAAWPFVYSTLSVVSLKTMALEKVIPIARGGQKFENETLPPGSCFVPRLIQKDAQTLRCYFANEAPSQRQAQTLFIDFDIGRLTFDNRLHKARIKTAAGVFDMQPQYFHADAVAAGFTRQPVDFGLYLFSSFQVIDGRTYVALNNYPGGQNALAVANKELDTFEVLGHYNEPQNLKLTESAVNRLPDGSWLAICRQEGGTANYLFTTSKDGRTWTRGEYRDFVPNGTASKPTFDKFGDLYYLGWQERTTIRGVGRSVFNIDISRDGRQWERKYRFETVKSFQYPSFHEHNGSIWLSVTQGDADASHKDRIMFGKLEATGGFASQKARTNGLSAGPNATVLKDGRPYRGIGINYFDCFLRTQKKGDDTSYDAGFATLAAKGIPFARFCATGFWPKDMRLYQTDRAEYFRRLDGVVNSARKHGIGLVPSLFWFYSCVPDLAGEPMDQWANPASKTQAWMREYVRELVTRYRDNPTIWAWELGNEYSLQADLPNAKEHRPAVHPSLGTPAARSEHDDLTFDMVRSVFVAFATEVRKHDAHRLIVTGDSFPRLSAWHQEHENKWTHDAPGQFAEMLAKANPDPISGISLHAYEDDDQRFATAMAVSHQLNKPLFIGEFGAPGETAGQAAKCRRLLKSIVDQGIPLAALWVFDLSSQKDYSVTSSNARSWQLDLLAEANKQLRATTPSAPASP